jgi:hypothetical protein
MVTYDVFYALRTEVLNIIHTTFDFKGLNLFLISKCSKQK